MSTDLGTCAVNDCFKPKFARGLCTTHYGREQRAANPEKYTAKNREWKKKNAEHHRAYHRELMRKRRQRFCDDCGTLLQRGRCFMCAPPPPPPPPVVSGGPCSSLKARPKPRRFTAGFCAEDRKSFVVSGNRGDRFCSPKCGRRNDRRVGRGRRRVKVRGTMRERAGESIDLAKVAERDGWCCHICGRKVSRKNWSLDHLIPISDGGPHTYENVALAHHLCNSKRGRTGVAQLRLMA